MLNLPTTPVALTNQTGVASPTLDNISLGITWEEQLQTWAATIKTWEGLANQVFLTNL